MTRRLYASLTTAAKTNPAVARKEGMQLLVQLLGLVVLRDQSRPAILDAVLSMPTASNLELQIVADMLNRSTSRPVDISTGSHRTMTWLEQRFATPDGKWASLDVLFYWDRDSDHVLVRLEGDPEAMALCSVDTLWHSADADYHALPGEPKGLTEAIAAAADH